MSRDDAQRPTRVLVSAASKHGATAEIADHLGAALRGRGLDVTVAEPSPALGLDGYDAVILGSAVYAGQWRKEAKELAERLADRAAPPPIWLFSSGPVGPPPPRQEEPVDVSRIVALTSPREHRLFPGKIDKGQLSFGERAIVIAVRATEGDDRDWDELTRWADGIADALEGDSAARSRPHPDG